MKKFLPTFIFLVLIIVPFVLFLAGGWCVEPGHACPALVTMDHTASSFSGGPFPMPLLAALIFITSLANPTNAVIFILIALLVLLLIRERFIAALFFTGLVLGIDVVFAGKDFFNRPRPSQLIYSFTRLGASYPSGHAFIGIVFYGFIGYVLWHHLRHPLSRWLVAFITIMLIAAIGFSRVALDFHWLTDIIGGWLLGGAVLTILIVSYRHLHRHISVIQ